MYLVDLGSKAGSFREVNQEYNQADHDSSEMKPKETKEQQEQNKEKRRKRNADLMIEKLQTLPINKVFLSKLGKPEKLRLAHALKTGVVDVEKVNAMASVGSLELLRQTIDGITEEDLNRNVDVTGFAGEILESEKLRPWVPMKMTPGIDKVKIGFSTRHYYLVPDYSKVLRYLEKKQRDLVVESKMLSLRCKAENDTNLSQALKQDKILKKLYVSGIDDTMTRTMIREVFESYGEIEEVRIPTTIKGKYKGFCFVTFKKEKYVKEVLKSTGFYIKGKRLTVKLAEEDKNELIHKLERFERKIEKGEKIVLESDSVERKRKFSRPSKESRRFGRRREDEDRRHRFREDERSKKTKKIKKKERKKDKKSKKSKSKKKFKKKRKSRENSRSVTE
jgi:hypothetical protein